MREGQRGGNAGKAVKLPENKEGDNVRGERERMCWLRKTNRGSQKHRRK